MPWGARNTVSLREEFVRLASRDSANMSQLCRQFSISRPTAYKWLRRFASAPKQALEDRSRRPRTSPAQTDSSIEARVVALRKERPAWGGRKLWRVLTDQGVQDVPAPSTITSILHRHGLIHSDESGKHTAFQRFERAAPNEMWQMDFKGYFKTDQGQCHPLTILDDHSRYAVGLFACGNERERTVRDHLTQTFRRYGMPQSILCDNGSPWGPSGAEEPHTTLSVWLMQLGVRMLHGRPYHPQTQGKDERFHRTLKTEVLHRPHVDLRQCQTRFDAWRHDYNWIRPHHALNLDVPGKHFESSMRRFPERLPEADYRGAGVEVRRVDSNANISMFGRYWRVGKAFIGHHVAIEPTTTDGVMRVNFFGHEIKKLDRRSAQ